MVLRCKSSAMGLHHHCLIAIQGGVIDIGNPEPRSLKVLGWTQFFADQLDATDAALVPMRIATVHRSRMTAEAEAGAVKLNLTAQTLTTDFAVGDWILADPSDNTVMRRLDRSALLQRKTEGARAPQLIAANVDTLFIVTSCNEDFNPARLERYLALANEAGTRPVIVLTKADKAVDPAEYQDQAVGLQRGLEVVTVNAKSPSVAATLAPWCGLGQTVALIGSSGVGKSTLLNTLANKTGDAAQATGDIREDDAKGRHTTTSRSLHAISSGGWVIDTPGVRTLHVSQVSDGLDRVFQEITEIAANCRFRDCTHQHEPGCVVQAAVTAGTIDPLRLARWTKLAEENRDNTKDMVAPRGNKKPKFRGKKR